MDGVGVLTEAVSSGAAASASQSLPHSKTREAKCPKTCDDVLRNSKTAESNCRCPESESSGCVDSCVAKELADALEVKVNLDSEHCMNGLTNGISQENKTMKCISNHSDAKSYSESPSPCECTSASSEHNGTSSEELEAIASSKSAVGILKETDAIVYVSYESELQMPDIMRIMNKDLSEPYSIYTYRYFIYNWPKLCFLAMIGTECVGAIVCKLDLNRKSAKRGYIAMLAVDGNHRNKGIGSNLVLKAIGAMVALNADEVVLESEITNSPALRLYENLGFVRDKRLFRYYLNGVDAFRLKLWLK
ncbi:N-alpha-acetyltransferase 30-like [Thrips palmi]|uniref:N-terminal methionine N(alpha)-acetyltransferase NatC n=1 Tax=Thrips palmi TaxID=161013 RepID=A0A6P8ZLY5_THRPL|nr:N-alpha-acetyltransferase 30-like [Thrips palmi]